MNWCFNCNKEDASEINNVSEHIIKKQKSNTISFQNQKTRTNSQIKNKSVSSFIFSKEQNDNNKSHNIKKTLFDNDSLLQISSIGFNSSMNSSISNLTSLRFCYEEEDTNNNIQKKSTNKLRPPKTKIVYDNLL